MTHTAGEWKQVDWHKIKHMPEGSARCIVADGKIIAMLEWDCTGLRGVAGDYSHFVSLDERNANAQLFEAAPDLLATCEATITFLDAVIEVNKVNSRLTPSSVLRLHGIVTAALAKAQGNG